MDRMNVVIILLLTALVVNLAESSEKCIVTHSPTTTTTTYNISEFSIYINCHYQWHVNGTVKANENDRGLGSSPSFFTTLGCMEKVCVKIECPQHSKRMTKQINPPPNLLLTDQDIKYCCPNVCPAAQQLDGHAKPPTQPPTDEHITLGVGIGVAVIGLLVIVLLVWRRAKMKKKPSASDPESPRIPEEESIL